MPTPLQYAEATVRAANNGRMSQFAVNIIMKALAEDVSGGNMAKFLETPVGKVFLRPKEARTSVAEEIELHKAERWLTKEHRPISVDSCAKRRRGR